MGQIPLSSKMTCSRVFPQNHRINPCSNDLFFKLRRTFYMSLLPCLNQTLFLTFEPLFMKMQAPSTLYKNEEAQRFSDIIFVSFSGKDRFSICVEKAELCSLLIRFLLLEICSRVIAFWRHLADFCDAGSYMMSRQLVLMFRIDFRRKLMFIFSQLYINFNINSIQQGNWCSEAVMINMFYQRLNKETNS